MTEPEHLAPGYVPRRIGVIGGGRMGSGIAHAFLAAGNQVLVIETDGTRAEAARESIIRQLRRSVDRGTLADADTAAGNLRVDTDMAELATADLVIEAVPEIAALKADVLSAVTALARDDALIATNTSSMSITDLAGNVSTPERFIGMHFFNPVPASQLVEVVIGQRTHPDTVAAAREIVASLGKVAITVSDSPGFASSRLGVLLGLEAIRMVEDGVAEPADIDSAMVLGYGHPMGPLRLTDLVGLDVRLDIARHLSAHLGGRFAPPQLLVDKVARGELGRKSGRGFYSWA